ncbi:MFS transporter [Pseudoalteromonas sp. S558]|uniref:MFS transporter n=1 Tax=Pseudoalteromonas sp. S558 TaxID=2066515 RepID=UPI00110A214E|nr:MFS transporter [Pseudoalteromonas sp. S558]TMN98380.1 hypothetical protein CWB66_16515 [Pseudoalteromonas sp. S558]
MGRFREKARRFYEKNQVLCSKLNRSQKFYYFGFVVGLISAFWYVTPFSDIFFSVFVAAGLLLTCGVASDILIVYKKVWETNIGKGLILVIYAVATNFAYALSSQIVNEIVTFESSKLIYSINLVAVMLVPLFILAFTYLVFVVILIFGQFYMLIIAHAEQFKTDVCLKHIIPEKIEDYAFRTFLVRFFVFPSILGFYWGISGHAMPAYKNFVENTTKAFIYNLEAKKFSRCKISKGQKVIEINDKEIVVVEKLSGDYSFSPQTCSPTLKPNKKLTKGAEKNSAPVS